MKNTTISRIRNTIPYALKDWYFGLLVLFVLTGSTTAFAQTGNINIGSGTSNNSYYLPARAWYGYSYTQQIVTASDYAAAGGVAGPITKIRYYISNATGPLANWNNWTVYIGHTSKSSFASNTDWETMANLTQVYTGTVTQVANSWMEITFTTPFVYNGTSNLVVAVDENSPLYSDSEVYFGSYTGATNTGIYFYDDDVADNPNPASPPTATGRTSTLPRLQLVGQLASCLSPSGVTATSNSSSGGTVNWTASQSTPANGYEYYYSATNTAPTASTPASGSVGAGVTTANITGLLPNTTYYVWVRSVCSATETSTWSPSGTFLTLCNAVTVPFNEAFGAGTIPSCWTTSSSNPVANGLWKFTGAVDYAPGNTRPNGTFAWVDGSDPSTINDVTLTSPLINLAGLTVPELVFDYFSNNTNIYPNNIFKVDVFNGTTWTNLYTNNTSNANWRTINTSLAAYAGTTIRLRFVVDKTAAAVGWAFYNDILLDNVIIQETPLCPAPTNILAATASLTSGTVSWTAPSSAPAEGYEYYYASTNTAPADATAASGTVAAGVTTATLSGLTTGTTYYVWVRSKCSATVKSPWVGPASFKPDYCTPAPSSVDGTGITNVTIGTINNTTVAETNNYGNYSAMVTNAALGSTVNFSIGYGTCAGTTCYTYGTKIWIDFNNDADFDDAGELVYTGLSGNVAPIVLSGSFTIPTGTTVGSHRLRIGATDTDTGPTGPCYTGSWGAFEDYTINIFMPPAPAIVTFTPASVCAATGDITITGTDLANATALTIGGTAVTISTNTNTQITATVPAGVSGVVAVTTIAGTSTTVGTFAVSTPPVITLSGANTVICAGDTSGAVTIATGAALYDTFDWSPSAGVSGTAATGYTFNPTATTTYMLTASNSTTGCVTTATYTVNVNALPTELIMDDAASICEGGDAVAISLQGGVTLGTIFTENFNGATNGWTTVNNSTGGTPANAAWTLREDGYEIPGYNEFVFSNDNTQFYLSNSDSQGSGSTTSVILRSPAFSTAGYTSANVTFHHFYMQYQTSTAKVEASVNGTDWTTLQTFSSNQGEYGDFEMSTVALTAAFLNKPVVYIRFKFDAAWGYFWGIDNVSISGQQTGEITWAPMAGLYTDAAATVAYTGQHATSLYAKPTLTTTYTATATNAAGCTTTEEIVVNYTSSPAPTVDNDVQIFCNAGTVGDLEANGTGIQWYTMPTGGEAIDPATALAEGVTLFYGSQTVNGCESMQRVAVAAMVNVYEAPIAAQSTQSFCAGSGVTVADLMVYGQDIAWYADATTDTPLAADTMLESGVTYYASQTIFGCESAQRVAVTVQFNVTLAPQATADQYFCNSGTVAGLEADGTDIQWYAAEEGGEPLAGDTAIEDGMMYYASQTMNGCESTDRMMVTAHISEIAVPTGDAMQMIYEETAGTATIEQIVMVGDNVIWYATEDDAINGTNPLEQGTLLESGATYYATQTVNGCTSAPYAVTVTVSLGSEVFDASQFTYYPNPVKDVLTIKYSSDIASVTVYNLLGQQVLAKQINATTGTIDMSVLQDGTYILNVTSGDSVKTVKVIKRH